MNWGRKVSHLLMMILLCVLIFYVGIYMQINIDGEELPFEIHGKLMETSGKMFLSGLFYPEEEETFISEKWVTAQAFYMMPLSQYVQSTEKTSIQTEDDDTYEKILEMQASDENEVDENGKLLKDVENPSAEKEIGREVSLEKLKDYEYLISNFYTVDSSTSVSENILNVDKLLKKDMKLDTKSSGPKVLIYHTHSQEAFKDSEKGKTKDTIMGMGEYLTEILNQKYKIETMHHEGVYDLIDGNLDRSKAYQLAEPEIKKILEENPSIEVVIDLHRDGVKETTHLVTEINGRKTAQIMFFNGLSRTRANGDIGYLANPYIEDNLAFSLQMQLEAAKKYPGFTRRIYLKSYRYNMHLMPKTLLIEAGAQTNTVEEMRLAMEVLAEVLDGVLTK